VLSPYSYGDNISLFFRYASSFRFSGDYVDEREVDDLGRRKTRIVAIDALCSPGMRQYRTNFLLRSVGIGLWGYCFCGCKITYICGLWEYMKIKFIILNSLYLIFTLWKLCLFMKGVFYMHAFRARWKHFLELPLVSFSHSFWTMCLFYYRVFVLSWKQLFLYVSSVLYPKIKRFW